MVFWQQKIYIEAGGQKVDTSIKYSMQK